jgi:hypothetical protein
MPYGKEWRKYLAAGRLVEPAIWYDRVTVRPAEPSTQWTG